MLKTIYLIRHGQTDYNKKGIVQGSGIDASLNDLGRQQAEAFYDAYRNMPFDKIYISALKRTKESVTQFIADGIPFEAMAGLNEISWGNSEGTEFTSENNTLYQKLVNDWLAGNTHLAVEGGESPEDVMTRQKEAMEYILQQPNEKNILICMHG
ncbi:MAG: histidine phosphatase family protein, partial [bacterium]